MNIFTPLAFFAFILSIYMGIYVMRLNSVTATNRVFLGLAISMAIWNLAYMFVYPDIDKSHVFFWYKISALGWCNFPAFVLHFFLLLARKDHFFKKISTWILIYLPGLLFTFKAFTGGFLAKDFEPGPGNTLFEIQNTESVWYILYVIYLWIFILSGVLMFADFSRKSNLKKIKSQSKIFLIAVSVLFAAIFTTNMLLPALDIRMIPAVGNIILIFWMLTIWYTIVKYKLMSFTVKSAANKLISKMEELLFFVDTDGKIIRINNFTRISLSLDAKELINTKFSDWVDENQKVRNILENIHQVEHISDLILNLKDSIGKLLPVSLSFSAIKDKTGDLLGTLIVGRDITLTIQLQKELAYHKEAELRIQQQNEVLIQQKEELQTTLVNLKNTQVQLIQAEKMALLGELTAGITHEIQNPLNFVNNFSAVSTELVDELKKELAAGNNEEALNIADDIKLNLGKINQHGRRADAIVKGMLQQSRSSTGIKEPADINALADEYLHLSYYGLRAKDRSFIVTLKTDFDTSVGKINVVPQDIGRVILNLISNAFYAVSKRKKLNEPDYEPIVIVTTKLNPPFGGQGGSGASGKVSISVKDNGTGIPRHLLDKIFQPFFTTKPTGEGTGLGLSLAYDIVTKGHGGELKVVTKEGEGSEFIISLPIENTGK
jgi:PAS domain S-box-containing protein